MSALAKAKELQAKLEAQRKETLESSKTLFSEAARELFDDNPDIQSFSWTQYTPYFMDGDPCVFSAGIDYPTINPREDGEENDSGETGDYARNPKYMDNPSQEDIDKFNTYKKRKDVVTNFLGAFDQDTYKELFGDGYKITVRRSEIEGFAPVIEIEDYEHD